MFDSCKDLDIRDIFRNIKEGNDKVSFRIKFIIKHLNQVKVYNIGYTRNDTLIILTPKQCKHIKITRVIYLFSAYQYNFFCVMGEPNNQLLNMSRLYYIYDNYSINNSDIYLDLTEGNIDEFINRIKNVIPMEIDKDIKDYINDNLLYIKSHYALEVLKDE